MRIFKPSSEKLTKKLVSYVYKKVRTNGIIRVEDVLSLTAVIVAEGSLKTARGKSIDKHDSKSRSTASSEKILEILTGSGEVKNWNELPSTCVFSRVKNKIDPYFNETSFPPLEGILKSYGKSIGTTEWGNLVLHIPKDSTPSLSFLETMVEAREFIYRKINLKNSQKTLTIAIDSLSRILVETRIGLNPTIALMMTFEIIYGMSKFKPHSCKKEIYTPV